MIDILIETTEILEIDRGSSRDDRRTRRMLQQDCGTQCEIPFVPKHDRPVYCSDCFRKNKPQDPGNDRYTIDIQDRNSRNDRGSRHDRSKRICNCNLCRLWY